MGLPYCGRSDTANTPSASLPTARLAMEALLQDLKYAARQLLRSPAFALVATLTLAVGIGANTALFSLATAILARPLPESASPEGLVWITPVDSRGGHPLML